MPVDYSRPVFTGPNWKPVSVRREKKVKRKEAAKVERKAQKAVDERDKFRCQLSGARLSLETVDPFARVHRHHILQKGRDLGPDASWNEVTVSSIVHDLLHANLITVSGDADDVLTWTLNAKVVEEVFGKRRVQLKTARGHRIGVVAKEDWQRFLREQAR